MFRIKRFVIVISIVMLVAGCASTANDWSRASEVDTKEAYLKYLRKYPEGEHWREAVDSLKRFVPLSTKYVIPEFQKVMEQNPKPTKMKVSIRSAPEGYNVEGELEFSGSVGIGDEGQFVKRDPFKPMLWNPGAEHTLIGAIDIGGFKFFSDDTCPLVFKLVWNEGYVYQSGTGIVVSPSGEVVYVTKP